MTLIVGILCTDGVVLGSDSAVTFGSSQQPTITQPSSRKIQVVADSMIVAGTGQLGLGQRFVDNARTLWREKAFAGKEPVDIGRTLAHKAVMDFANTAAPKEYGALVALPQEKRKCTLIEFSLGGLQPEVTNRDSWYVSMGSGQSVADPLLGFVRAVFWGDEQPNLQDGIFCAMLVLRLACEMAPMGVAAQIQMAILEPRSKGEMACAKHLTSEELVEHHQHVNDVMDRLKQLRHGAPPGQQPPMPQRRS